MGGGGTLHLGIDPGMNGGIAAIYPDGGVIWPSQYLALRMPKTDCDIWTVFKDLIDVHRTGNIWAVIERVNAMPGQGVSSTFKFGMNYGFLRACLTAAKIPYQEVSPRKWQAALGVPARKKTETKVQHKNKLKQKAQQLFPDVKVSLATADALLLARYACLMGFSPLTKRP